MTCKIKRRNLRCGGRPKADFGSIFTTFIAPALGVAGSVADSAISKTQVSKSNTKPAVKETNTEVTNNNTSVENLPTIQVPTKEPISGLITSNTIIPSDPTKTPTMRLGGRKKCWIGAAIGAATSIAGSLFGAAAQKREMRRQKSIQDWQNTTQEATNMTTALNNSQDYQEDYLRQFRTAARLGKTLGAKGIYITDGGDATKIGNNTYLLRGGSHEDVNETGQTGIGINVGGNEVEAEGGEVAQKKNGALRIFSAQPILGGISPAQAVMNGANKDKIFNAQQQFKRRHHLSDDGKTYKNGGSANKPRIRRVKNYGFTDATPYPNDEIKPTVVTSRLNLFERLAKFVSRNLMELGRTGLLDHEGLNVAQDSYLVPTKAIQAKMFADAGYTRDYNAEKNRNYGLVKKGVGNRNIPIYSRTNPNFGKQRKDLVVLGNNYNIDNVDKALVHAGSYPSAIYSDNEGNIYINSWDLNDYGADAAGNTGDLNYHYGSFRKKLAKSVDAIGNPTVVTTGYQRALDNNKPIKISNYSDYYNLSNNGNNEAIKEALDNWMIKQGVELNEIGYGSPLIEIVGKRKHRLGGRCKLRNGGLTSKDRGSSKYPYPSVSSKDFAGGGRSYPIPTKADAVDALRLAGLHGRSDVKSKVYSKYPELRKKARGGAEIEPYYDWARNTSSNLGISFIDPDYDYRAYYNSVTPYERALIRFAPKETHFTDIGKTPKHATFSNESKYSNDKTPGGTWNGNVFVPNIWQFGNNGNNRRNKYMNNSGEGYFNGRVDVFPTSRKRHRLGCSSRPIKGMRPKANTGIFVPYNKRYTSIYDAPDYSSDYNGGNVLGNGEVTVTAKRIKPTFMKPNNDAMNIINHPANETPYIPQRHNRSRTIFSGGDYLGLGIDTLAALSTGLVNYNTAGKYVLPDRAPIIQASKLPTTYNVNPEIEEVKRYRDRLTGQTFNNTSSSVAALNRSGAINLDALSNLSKLWATKENEENKMLTEDAKNQQTVAAQNVQNELARQSEIARIKNEATQAKGDALNVGLSGLSQAWTNFWTAGRTAYEDDQSRRAMIASSKDATPTRLMEMDFDLSPDVIAALYRSANEDRTKRFYLSRLSPKQRQKYGIN